MCSQKGLVECFDSTIGAGTVMMPYGGKYQLTPAEGMVAKLPVETGKTTTGTIMTYGFNPVISKWSPFHGAVYAVVESLARLVAIGGDYKQARLTFQEYFEKLGTDPEKWGKPLSALLGAFYVQNQLKVASIGGKDSMSGTFGDMHVPPTLVSFALAPTDITKVISPEFKKVGSSLVLLSINKDELLLPDFKEMEKIFTRINTLIKDKVILSASAIKSGGLAEAICKMAFGNGIGVKLEELSFDRLFKLDYGAILVEVDTGNNLPDIFDSLNYTKVGETISEPALVTANGTVSLKNLQEVWENPLESIFPTKTDGGIRPVKTINYTQGRKYRERIHIARPRVFIPVFPGTNCEYDVKRKFESAGAIADVMVLRNLTPREIEDSINQMKKCIDESNMIMIPGGFSAGDEPEGSGKFTATVFRNPYLAEAVMDLLNNRDGLILGICNGFQALVKLGLLPYGEIRPLDETSPTLTFNTIGRHVSRWLEQEASNLSPAVQR